MGLLCCRTLKKYENFLPKISEIYTKLTMPIFVHSTDFSVDSTRDSRSATLCALISCYNGNMNAVNDLATALAKTAKKLAETLENILRYEPTHHFHELLEEINSFSITNVEPDEFADICAQTITYGMFVGRWKTKDTLPKSPPFLHKLFSDIAETNSDDRIRSIIDELIGILQATDLEMVTQGCRKTTQSDDVSIYFYEAFLKAYNPDLRKLRGVFYTPQPVVKYIVSAVDDILQQEFNLCAGIADNVQILDPATGTGTFLVEVVKQIHAKIMVKTGQSLWKNYVTNNLLLRLHGFDILMTPYLIAHLKLAATLEETGCRMGENQCFNIHLANALEPLEFTCPRNNPSIMVILGNPPYNVSTINKGDNPKKLIENYKKNLEETKINLDDDYIKFIALGEQFIGQNNISSGVLAYISNNSFLEGVTHRNMRKSLLKTFDRIYILNLHGDVRKKESAPDGSKDENVFNIMQGTSINIFVRSPSQKEISSKVFYADLYGKRTEKYRFLEMQNLKTSGFTEIYPEKKYYFFVPKDLSEKTEYEQGFGVEKLFLIYNSGIKTDRDLLFVDDNKKQLANRLKKFLSGNFDETFRKKYRIEDSSSYKLTKVIRETSFDQNFLRRVTYRPFDEKWIYYDPSIVSRSGKKVMQHMHDGNVALLTSRSIPSNQVFNRVFITSTLADGHVISDQTYVFPLYIYDSFGKQHMNLNVEIIGKIANQINTNVCLLFDRDIFDYVYGVLHDLNYRAKYQEFLKIDFPRVPYPKDAATFDQYVRVGSRLRKLHLLEDVPEFQTTFPVSEDNVVKQVRFVEGKVFINGTQYFDCVPASVWECYIGAYRPAQKYLKDRKGRVLSFEEIRHYQKIVAVLNETLRFRSLESVPE